MDSDVTVHPLSDQPTAAWEEISKTQKVIKVDAETPSKPVEPNKIRFVCMSDTHSLIRKIAFDIPSGDVFIHAGDFTNAGQKDDVIQFNKWLGTLPHKHKIVIAGNHELSFDNKFSELFRKKIPLHFGKNENQVPNYGNIEDGIVDFRQYLTNCVYLEDSGVELYGVKLYGSPWQPEFGGWAFNLKRGQECLSKWERIPENTDILITHGPPLGHGDLVFSGVRAGCVELLKIVQQKVRPKYHIFGHVHEGYGVSSDGKITFINASTCDRKYAPNNLPIVFDIPLPDGFTKD